MSTHAHYSKSRFLRLSYTGSDLIGIEFRKFERVVTETDFIRTLYSTIIIDVFSECKFGGIQRLFSVVNDSFKTL